MSKNGLLPSNELAPVHGGGRLRADAARAYNALDRYLKANGKGSLSNSGDGATYRPLGHPGDYAHGGPFTQWMAWERYQHGGNLAAQPGTSNHGLGLAVDFTPAAIGLVAQYGNQFGWAKHGDAMSENWHYTFKPGKYLPVERWSQVLAGETVTPGDIGPGVLAMKKRLKAWGAWPALWRTDNRYAGRTGKAVEAFQRARGLKADGIVGPGTWKALNATPRVAIKRPVVKPKPPVAPRPPLANKFADLYSGDSHYDAHAYEAAGHTHIGLKASEGHDWTDPAFVERWNQSAHLSRWAYHFARPSNNPNPLTEARNFANMLGKVKLTKLDRICLDWEDPAFASKDGTKWVQSFVDCLAKYGYETRVIYSGGFYIADTLKRWPSSHSGPLRYWNANYSAKPESSVPKIAAKHLVACQYTDGTLGPLGPKTAAGIGPCDMSYFVNPKR